MASNARHPFSAILGFEEAITKIVAVPKATMEDRESKWKAARKKRKRIKRASGK